MTTHNQTIAWDDRQLDLLHKLWTSGMSASQIGEQLGITRNAVMGKVYRLGITRVLQPASRAEKAEGARYARAGKLLRRPAEVKPIAAPRRGRHHAGNKTIFDLEAHDCRFPLSDPNCAGMLFCGAQTIPGRPYCQTHCDIAGPKPSRRIA
jgi:GcrA cell cycle regulator